MQVNVVIYPVSDRGTPREVIRGLFLEKGWNVWPEGWGLHLLMDPEAAAELQELLLTLGWYIHQRIE